MAETEEDNLSMTLTTVTNVPAFLLPCGWPAG
jgi:hypothetical protein